MTPLLVGLLITAALVVLRPPAFVRVDRAGTPARRPHASAPTLERGPVSLAAAVALGLAVALVVEGPAGLVAGVAVAGGSGLALRRLVTRARRPDPLRPRDAALLGELIAACVDGGAPLTSALRQVAASLPTPTGAALASATRLLDVGTDPATALADLLADPATARLARGVLRALESGAAPGPVLRAAAAGQRDTQRSARIARARGIGSRAALPVGLCFLPAFVLVAVVPVVVGGLSRAVP
jgi:pilus assembly protein TadC